VRPIYSFTLRSTLNSSMVNEARVGLTSVHGNSAFGQESDPSSNASSFADIGGYAIDTPFANVTEWWTDRTPNWRAAPTYTFDNSLTWQKGSHSLNIGGGYLKSSSWENQTTVVPQVSLGMSSSTCTVAGVTNPCDPAFNLFTSTTIPGADATQLGNARAHFAQMTGRITTVSNQVALDPNTNLYVPNSPRRREGAIGVWSAYAQDSWRMSPTVTLTGGLRWDVQTPFTASNDTMSAVEFEDFCGISGLGDNTTPYNKCAFFSRKNTGLVPEYVQLTSGTKGYKTDWNNVAPSISLAWRPNVQSGFLRTLLGDPETATLRGGYSVSFERQGLAQFTGVYGANPGSTLTVTRNTANGNLVNAGETWPLLYRDRARLYDGAYPAGVTYPIAIQANRASGLTGFAPDLQIRSRENVDGRFPALAVAGHGGGGALCRHARCGSVVHAELQRTRPRDQRVHQRVQERGGEPEGEQRIRRRQPRGQLRLLRSGNGHQPAADLYGVPRRAYRQSGDVPVYRHGLDEHRDHARHVVRQREPEQRRGGPRQRCDAAR
jgi:hypothetical protein